MKFFGPVVLFAILFTVAFPAWGGPEAFVNMKAFDFRIQVAMRWAGTETPMGSPPAYDEAKCLLRRPVAQALSRARAALELGGQRLRVVDCYRPKSVDAKMRAKIADAAGSPSAPRGNTVAVLLVDKTDRELPMPTELGSKATDEGRTKAKRVTAERNAKRLAAAMQAEGFTSFGAEWWRFEMKGDFPEEDFPFTAIR